MSYELLKIYQFSLFESYPRQSIFLQTIATIPDDLMDIAKANSPRNRYHNIHTCESENAKVYDTYNADTELSCKYSLWCSMVFLY